MTLGPQFHKIAVGDESSPWHTSWSTPTTKVDAYSMGATSDTYEYRPNPDEVGARMVVLHHGGGGQYEYPLEGKEHHWASQVEPGEQIPMFKSTYTAPSSTVDYFAGTRASRIPAMTLMGIAEVDTNNRMGRSLTSSRSLSPHSQRLVSHLQESGATEMPERISSNDLQFWGNNDLVRRYRPSEQLPESLVNAGRSRVRSVIRKGRGAKDTPVDQPQLPGT